MIELIERELFSHGISCFGTIPLSHCTVQKPYKLSKHSLDPNASLWAIMLAIPYYSDHNNKNISSYSVPRDYHLFFDSLFKVLIPRLKDIFKGYSFAGFADDSPICERDAAAKAGLGIIGQNGMLITPKYSSYVFLGEIITDLPLDIKDRVYEIKQCEGCGKCKSACPMGEIGECLSALTQKKGELTEEEACYIAKYGSAWGCDICQEVCPHTANAINEGTIYTDIPFFTEKLIPCLTSDTIEQMSDGEFNERAYSWRKRQTVKRNLDILENYQNSK